MIPKIYCQWSLENDERRTFLVIKSQFLNLFLSCYPFCIFKDWHVRSHRFMITAWSYCSKVFWGVKSWYCELVQLLGLDNNREDVIILTVAKKLKPYCNDKEIKLFPSFVFERNPCMAGIYRSVIGNPKQFKTIVWDKRANETKVSFRKKKTDRFFYWLIFFSGCYQW